MWDGINRLSFHEMLPLPCTASFEGGWDLMGGYEWRATQGWNLAASCTSLGTNESNFPVEINLKFTPVILICLTLSARVAMGAEIPDTYETCSQVLRQADKAGAKVSAKQVAAVLNVANAQCLSSAETSEWLNEILFATLLVHPADFVAEFGKAAPAIRKNVIAELESPVNDGIDLPKVYRAVLSVKGQNGEDKQAILSALRAAGAKLGLQLR